MKKSVLSFLLLTASAAIAMDKVTPEDRAQLISHLRQIQYAVNLRVESGTNDDRKNFLIEQYDAIETIAKKYGIIHPAERNFLWLCSLDDALKSDGDKKVTNKEPYEKAQLITDNKIEHLSSSDRDKLRRCVFQIEHCGELDVGHNKHFGSEYFADVRYEQVEEMLRVNGICSGSKTDGALLNWVTKELEKCDIRSLHKRSVLKALYGAARKPKWPRNNNILSEKEFDNATTESYIWTLGDRNLYVDITKDTLNTESYNRTNGTDAAQKAIAKLKAEKFYTVNNLQTRWSTNTDRIRGAKLDPAHGACSSTD